LTQFYVCREAFGAQLGDPAKPETAEIVWCKIGDRVRSDDKLFEGESGKNRMRTLFRAEELVGAK
jgi:hypothetical protein